MKVDYSQSLPLSQRKRDDPLNIVHSPKIQYYATLRHETII